MKTKLTLIALVVAGAAQAQTLYKETFGNLTLSTINSVSCATVPANMQLINVGNKVADASTNNRPFNASPFTTTAWVAASVTTSVTDTAGESTSWLNPFGVADKWLITPPISGINASTVLSWEAFAPDAQYADGYEVWVSAAAGASSTPTTTDFTALGTNKVFTIAAEASTGFVPHGISLTAFAGQTVRVAFRNNSNDKFHLYVDDIMVVANVSAKEGAVTSAASSATILGPSGGNVNLTAVLKNNGSSTITSAVIKYKIDNGAAVPQTFNPNIGFTGTFNAVFNAVSVTGVGAHKIKMWVDDINTTGPDGNASNDTSSVWVYVASQTVQRKVLYEGFSSSTCGPCASANPALHAFLVANGVNTTNGKVAAVKYQMNYPGAGNDPAYTTEATTRHNLYQVAGIPHGVVDGNTWSDHPANITQGVIDGDYNIPSPWEFQSLAFNPAGTTLTGTLKSYVDYDNTNGKLKLFCAFTEDMFTSGDNGHGVQSNGETTWYEVMRKMVPNDQGTTLPNQTNNGNTPINLSFTFSGTPKVFTSTSKMTAVVWVQDMTDLHVYQAGVAGNATAIIDADSKLSTLDIYPNPTNENATIRFTLKNTENVEISVYNMMGEMVQSNKLGSLMSGSHSTAIDASGLANGMYHVNVTVGGQTTSKKFAVQK